MYKSYKPAALERLLIDDIAKWKYSYSMEIFPEGGGYLRFQIYLKGREIMKHRGLSLLLACVFLLSVVMFCTTAFA